MGALEQVDEAAGGVPDELREGASPKVIAGFLFADDRARFLAQYETALDEARSSHELSGVHHVVEHWRRIAALQSDSDGFRQAVRTVAELVSGEPTPDGEPFDRTRKRAGI